MWGGTSNGTNDAWSGGIVNDWLFTQLRAQDVAMYGSTMVGKNGNAFTRAPTASINIGKPNLESGEWEGVSSKWSCVANITGVKIGGYEPKVTMPPCPT